MRRRKRLMSRVILLTLAVTFVLMALNPLLRSMIQRSGQQVTGARVDIDGVRVSLLRSLIGVDGLRAADPYNPTRNLFEIGRLRMEIDPTALKHGQILVRRAQISEMKLGTRRATPGILQTSGSAEAAEELSDQFASTGKRWLAAASRELARGPGPTKSISFAQEFLDRWPNELNRLAEKAGQLNQRVLSLRGGLEEAGPNPLRNAESYQQAITELQNLGEQIVELRSQMGRVEQQVMMDQDAFVESKANDLDELSTQRSLGSIDDDLLNEFLLGQDISDRVTSLVQWLRWGRRFLPTLSDNPVRLRDRGERVCFPGVTPRSDIVIENLMLRGTHTIAGQEISFDGQIRGLASHPEFMPQPTEIVVQTSTGTPCLIQAKLHGLGSGKEDQVIVSCPRLTQPERRLGNEEHITIVVGPGELHYWARVTTADDVLRGELLLKEPHVNLTADLSSRFSCSALADLVKEAAQEVQHIDVSVQLRGTLDNPAWKLDSNLGSQLAANLKQVVQCELQAVAKIRLQADYARIDDAIGSLNEQLTGQRDFVLRKLQVGSDEIDRVREYIASRVEQTDSLIDDNSPLRETFVR